MVASCHPAPEGSAVSYCRFVACLAILLSAVGTAQAQEWKPNAPKGEGFKALMPGAPKETLTKTDGGHRVAAFTILANQATYNLVVLDVPEAKGESEEKCQQRLDNARDGGLRQSGGKLLSEKQLRLPGAYPGREVEVALPSNEGLLLARFYAVNGRVYLLMVSGPEAAVRSKDARKFLVSFELVK
jgi:hypothetical protein